MKYISKPVLIDAFPWWGHTVMPDWMTDEFKKGNLYLMPSLKYGTILFIKSPIKNHSVKYGNYIIKDKDGFIYSMSKQMFEDKYMEVNK